MIDKWQDILFAHPAAFYLFILLPVLIAWYGWRHNHLSAYMFISNWPGIEQSHRNWKAIWRHSVFVFKLFALVFFVIALAGPETDKSESKRETFGIDMVIALDVSPSMLAKDFKPNRIEAAKKIASDFINQRPNDRIGLVVFSGEAFTQCPVTVDHRVLLELLDQVKAGDMQSGTAIGSGLGTAVNRLKNSDAISKVIILLTDGVNNTGSTDPKTAAGLATTFGIRVHTIGVGTRGNALSPVGVYPNGQYAYDRVPVEIDEDLLKDIASETGGSYFRAVDNASLKAIYKTIDSMEKSRIELSVLPKKKLLFLPFILAGMMFYFLAFILKQSIFRTVI